MDVADSKDVQLHRAILSELGYEISSQSTILDFGCDKGNRVYEYRKLGLNAFGTDINLSQENYFLRALMTQQATGYLLMVKPSILFSLNTFLNM